jgi:hypothetical protein
MISWNEMLIFLIVAAIVLSIVLTRARWGTND